MKEIYVVDVYHSGDAGRPMAPFLFVPAGDHHLPDHPAPDNRRWTYWKEVPLAEIAAQPARAFAAIAKFGFFIQ